MNERFVVVSIIEQNLIPQQFADLLNDGWQIARADVVGRMIIYVLRKFVTE